MMHISIINWLVINRHTAVENGEGSLDKEAMSHDDLFDSFPSTFDVLVLKKGERLVESPASLGRLAAKQ